MPDYIGRFVKGGKVFDVSTPPYKLAPDFVPPSANLSYVASSGTSANRFGGSQLSTDKAGNILFNLPVIVLGDSEPEMRRARQNLAAFLALGSDRFEPMYFEFRPSVSIDAEPMYGQFGANSRLELVFPSAPSIWNMYGVANIRSKGERLDTTLACKPFIYGRRQILGTAKGGLTEDRIGIVDGFPRGLSIPSATSNLFHNPIADHETFDNDWTAGGGIVVQENTDKRFVLFGDSSFKVTSIVSPGNPFYQATIALSDTSYVVSVYAKLPSSEPVTSSHLQMYNGAAQTSTYVSMGDGWYLIYYQFSPETPANFNVGIAISVNTTIYLDGFQLEESAIVTAHTHGSLAGAAASGILGESSTVREAGTLTYPIDEVFAQDEGTARLVWNTQDALGPDRWFLCDDNGDFEFFYNGSGTTFNISDGTNAAGSSSTALSDFTTYVMHVVWGGGQGLKVYLEGVQIATDSSYTAPSTKATKLFLGSDEAAANQANGLFMEFSTYDVAMTAAQVAADYAILEPLLDDDKRISAIPFLWNKDGDGIADNCDDGTRDNWVIAGGIPGTHPAITRIDGEISPGWTGYALWISNFIVNDFLRPSLILWGEQSGTTTTSAESGSNYNQQSVSSGAAGTWSTSLSHIALDALLEKEVYLFTRLYDAGANLKIWMELTASGTIVGDDRGISTTTAFRLFKTPPLSIPDLRLQTPLSGDRYDSPAFTLKAQRTTGGSSNVRVDYIVLMPRPSLVLYPGATAAGNPEGFSYVSTSRIVKSKTASDAIIGNLQKEGDEIELVPNRYNVLVSLIGQLASTTTVTHTLTYERVYVTPRWSVL